MISIIVPIYNIEKYLGPCLNSILASTYDDYELILVDDGSTDGSSRVCDMYAVDDTRIRVIHQKNGGISSARNHGLELAKGEYIMFIDGDDMIHPRMLETLKTAIDSGNYDFSMILGKKVPEEFSVTNHEQISMDEELVINEIDQLGFISGIFSINDKYISVWNKLYKKDIVTGLRFEQHEIGEDLDWNTRISLRMKKAIIVNSQLYYYRLRKGSAIRSGITPSVINSIGVYVKCLDYVPENNRTYRAIVLKGIYTFMLQLRRYSRHDARYDEVKASCNKVFKKTRKEFVHSNISLFSKLRSLFGYYCPGPYNFILNRIESRALRNKV